MEDHTNIVLYSKFSPASRKIVEMIENLSNFNLLCIDNKKIRDRISKSEKLNVKEVPCIIRVYQDTGYAESFEGERAFRLVKTYIDQLKNSSSVPVPQMSQMIPQMSQVPQAQQMVPQQVQMSQVQQIAPPMMSQAPPMMSQVTPMMSQVTPMMSQAPPMMSQAPTMQLDPASNVSQLIPESQPRQDSIQKNQKLINATSIDDLGSDINRGQTMNTYMHVPKSVEFDIDIENKQRTVKQDRSVKSNDGNIVTRAMQMQKEREQESSLPGQRPIN